MPALDMLTVVAKALALGLGGVITALAYRAFRRTGSDALRAFAIGFGAITLGALFGRWLGRTAGITLQTTELVGSVFTTLGFGVLAYSLYATEVTTRRGSG